MGRLIKRKKQRRALFDRRFIRGEARRSYRMALVLFWSILLYFLIDWYVISVGVVEERSMVPTLPEGNYYLVNKYIYHFTRPNRGDIVVLRSDRYTTEQLVKRVIGLQNELLMIRGGKVYIDGHLLNEPYIIPPTFPDFGPYRIGKDTYFVMGDNRPESEDSRAFGCVSISNIDGKIKPEKLFPFF